MRKMSQLKAAFTVLVCMSSMPANAWYHVASIMATPPEMGTPWELTFGSLVEIDAWDANPGFPSYGPLAIDLYSILTENSVFTGSAESAWQTGWGPYTLMHLVLWWTLDPTATWVHHGTANSWHPFWNCSLYPDPCFDDIYMSATDYKNVTVVRSQMY